MWLWAMANKLGRYGDKRDPGRTNEPFGAEPMRSDARSGGRQTMAGSFVVHLHAARALHYDLRIEIAGVLQSFAVPRGPSLDPADKRLAVNTEDHPLEYLDFEAVIPAGNYGAGSMILWDRGAIRYLEHSAEEGLASGKIDFTLHGHKLRGRFALVQTKRKDKAPGKEWLLLKKQDAFSAVGANVDTLDARSVLSGLTVEELPDAANIDAALQARARELGARPLEMTPSQWTPMLCVSDDGPLEHANMLYELKLDGVRMLAERRGHDVSLRYRSGRNATDSFPEVARAMRALSHSRIVLDAEIIAFDEQGRPDFQRLGQRLHAVRPHEARNAMRAVPVACIAFDLLVLGDLDLRMLPLRARKELLASAVRGKGILRALDHLEANGQPLWQFCKTHGLEGVIAKRMDSRYTLGPRRTGDWIKIKRERDDDLIVVGYTRGEGARASLGALELASYVGDQLRYRGRVGSGLDERSIEALLSRLQPLATTTAAVETTLPAPAGRTFVEPKLVVSVHHAGLTRDGSLRHPVYRGLREDIAPDACTLAAPDERVEQVLQATDAAHRENPSAARGRVALTNQDKVFWPEEGYTKGDLCRYYDSMSETLLPYLRDRPVLMVRYPDGIAGKNFYQWNAPSSTPDWVRVFTVRGPDERDEDRQHERETTSFLVGDRDTLLYLANLACIPLHVLASRSYDLERCDFATIDFDLGGQPLAHAVEMARTLKGVLDQVGLQGFPKTSGQSGLHVLIPLGGAPFPAARALTELLGHVLLRKHPTLATLERRRDKRPVAVYIDTGQVGRARSIVAPYSVRAVRGATVSTPLTWDEVSLNLDPARFTIFSVPERIATVGDPMAGMLDVEPDLAAAVEGLGDLVRASARS